MKTLIALMLLVSISLAQTGGPTPSIITSTPTGIQLGPIDSLGYALRYMARTGPYYNQRYVDSLRALAITDTMPIFLHGLLSPIKSASMTATVNGKDTVFQVLH